MKNKSVVLIGLMIISSIINIKVINAKEEQNDKNLKIAVIDIQKIEEKSLISNDLRVKISKKETELHNEIISRKEGIERVYKDLEQNRATLSRVSLEQKAKQLEKDMQELQRDEKKYSQIFEMSKLGALNNLQQEAQKIIDKAGDKYDVIIPTSLMLYYKKEKFVDITDDVLQKLNKNVKVSNYDKFYNEAKVQVENMMKAQKEQSNKSNKPNKKR